MAQDERKYVAGLSSSQEEELRKTASIEVIKTLTLKDIAEGLIFFAVLGAMIIGIILVA